MNTISLLHETPKPTTPERRADVLWCGSCMRSWPADAAVPAAFTGGFGHDDCVGTPELRRYSPDVLDPTPHSGNCEKCGAPAPYRRVTDATGVWLCWDREACDERKDAQELAEQREHDEWLERTQARLDLALRLTTTEARA